MQAQDVMNSPVIAVAPDTSLAEVVRLLLAHRISGMPVVEAGRVVGMVGDGELVHRQEIGTAGAGHGLTAWLRRLLRPSSGAVDYVHAHGMQVRDVMNPRVVSVAPQTPLEEVAARFEDRRVRRLPVLAEADGRLLGLVTRADLVRAMAGRMPQSYVVPAYGDDEAIRTRLLAELAPQPWWQASWSSVEVDHGIVRYRGVVHDDAELRAARVAAENVPGVRGVEDRRLRHDQWQPMM